MSGALTRPATMATMAVSAGRGQVAIAGSGHSVQQGVLGVGEPGFAATGPALAELLSRPAIPLRTVPAGVGHR